MRTQPPPVKTRAVELGLPIMQPEDCNDPAFVAEIARLGANAGIVAAYGQMLRKPLRHSFPLRCWNVHASLLPKLRGASPINCAIINGEKRTGITIFRMSAGMDTGKMLLQEATDIGDDETAGELFSRLSVMGADAVLKAMDMIAGGDPILTAQDSANATYCGQLSKEDGGIDWNMPAGRLHNFIRGMTPWPGAYGFLDTGIGDEPIRLIIHKSRAGTDVPGAGVSGSIAPGDVIRADDAGMLVAAGEGIIILDRIQRAGKREMGAGEFLRGQPYRPGWRFIEAGR